MIVYYAREINEWLLNEENEEIIVIYDFKWNG